MRETVQGHSDLLPGLAQRAVGALDVLPCGGCLLFELGVQCDQTPRGIGELPRRRCVGSCCIELAQRVVHGHRQSRGVVRQRPEQHVIVEVILAAQGVGAVDVILVAQDHGAMWQRMDHRAAPEQPQVVAFGLLQRLEREYQHRRSVPVEVGRRTLGVGRRDDLLELLAQHLPDEGRVVDRLGGDEDACVRAHVTLEASGLIRPCRRAQSTHQAGSASPGMGRATK